MGMAAMQQQQMQQQQMQQQWLQQQQAAQAGQGGATPPPAAAPAAGGPLPMPDVMTPEQAADILQVTPADVIAAIDAGELKAKKIGAAYRISKANLEAYLAG